MTWHVSSTLLYGFGRAVTYDYEDTRKYWNFKHSLEEVKEMLVVDKVVRVEDRTFAALFMWPVMLRDDLMRLECRVRGKDRKEYKG